MGDPSERPVAISFRLRPGVDWRLHEGQRIFPLNINVRGRPVMGLERGQGCADRLDDEARHRESAIALGAAELPAPVKFGMRAMAKVMTNLAYRV